MAALHHAPMYVQLQLLDLPTTSLILEQFYLIIHSRIKMIYYDCCTLRLHKNFITCWLCACAHIICQNYNSTGLMTVGMIHKHLIVTQCCIYEHIIMLIFICCRFCGISVFTVL